MSSFLASPTTRGSPPPPLTDPLAVSGILLPPERTSASAGWDGLALAVVPCPAQGHAEVPRSAYHFLCLTTLRGGPHAGRFACEDQGRRYERPYTGQPLTLAPSGRLFSFDWNAASLFASLHVHLHPRWVEHAAQATGADPSRVELGPAGFFDAPPLEHIMRALLATLDGLPDRLFAEGIAAVLGAYLLRHHSVVSASGREHKGGLAPSQLRRVLDYIQAHLSSEVGLTDLAAVAALSPYHLCRQFKQTTGLAPHQYVLRERVRRAQHLLAESHSSLSEIALVCGFAHQSHLTAAFRRLTGTTPRRWRNER